MARTISNQARVTFAYEGSTASQTNTSNIVTRTISDRYDFEVEKSANTDCFRAGETITYYIQVTNVGCNCLSNFQISDNLGGEDYLTYVEDSARLFIDGSMEEITPTDVSPLEFEVNRELQRNDGFIIQYNVTVNEDISVDLEGIENTVTINAYPCGCKCNCNNNDNNNNNRVTKTASLTLSRCEYANVLIAKALVNDNVCCGGDADYTITLTNIGNIDATDVVVTDLMPEEFTATEIHMENNGVTYHFNASEYTIDAANFLTLPNASGTAILVPSLRPGYDNTTVITIHGHM